MLGLEKIIAGAKLRGIAGPSLVEVVRVEWMARMLSTSSIEARTGRPKCCSSATPMASRRMSRASSATTQRA
jgi:hypothetical protein